MLSDIFPKKILGSINGIFSSGVYVGGALASLSILLDGIIGWRNTLFVIGGIGVAVAVLCQFLVTEPRAVKDGVMKNGAIIDVPSLSLSPSQLVADTSEKQSTTATTSVPAIGESATATESANIIEQAFTGLQEVIKSDEAKYLLTASVLRFCAGFSIAIWKAPFVFAKFPESATSFAGKLHPNLTTSSLSRHHSQCPHLISYDII